MPDPLEIPTVRDLRRRWKPLKAGAAATDEHEAIRIRLHRCFSWMARAEHIATGEDEEPALDALLLYRWTAFNALYGRWDAEVQAPRPDAQCYRGFTTRLMDIDRAGQARIPATLAANRKLLESIAGDEFLLRHFWQDPDGDHGRTAERTVRKLREMLREGREAAALELVLDRVYLLRCQLVHGASTFGGRENRHAVRRSARLLELLLPEVAIVIIDGAWEGDWDGLCYPPVR